MSEQGIQEARGSGIIIKKHEDNQVHPDSGVTEQDDVIVSIPTKEMVSKIKQLCTGDSFKRTPYKDIEQLLKVCPLIVVWPLTSDLGPNSDSGNNYAGNKTYLLKGPPELNHNTFEQDHSNSYESGNAPMSKKEDGSSQSLKKGIVETDSAPSGKQPESEIGKTESAPSGEESESKTEGIVEADSAPSGKQPESEIRKTESAPSGEESKSKTEGIVETDSAPSGKKPESEIRKTESAPSGEESESKAEGIVETDSAPSGKQFDSAKEGSDVILCVPTPTDDSIVSEIKNLCRSIKFECRAYQDILQVLNTSKFVVVWQIDSKVEPNSDNEGAFALKKTPEHRNASMSEGEDSGGLINISSFPSWLKKTFTTNDSQNSKSRQQSKSSNVQFFVPIKTATTQDFSNAINDLIQDNSFKCIICSGIENLSDESPLVVVCPISSRFEPDIDSAIDGIKWKNTFVVLLLHSGLESSLPRMSTASRLAHTDKYKNIVFIDVAYTKDEKLYQCQMNENATNQLKGFLQNYTKNNLD